MNCGGECNSHYVDAKYSIGLNLREDGTIVDTIEGLPAAAAGVGPGMKLIGVNGRHYSSDILRDALKAAKTGIEPIELLVENTDYYKVFKLDYHGGERYPHLVRDETKPDLLTDIYNAK
jgi:predicted metalloprotease with PDZ domain